jgi:hypothetical protein
MRTSIFAIIVVAGSAVALPAMAQQKPEPQQAAPSEQTTDRMHGASDSLNTTGQANEQMQRDADKGLKTRNSGESGYVGDQDKPGSSAHPPGAGK